MMTQKKMDNDLKKYLWGEFIDGNTSLTNLDPKAIEKKYNFNINSEDLNEQAKSLKQVFVTIHTDSQIDQKGVDMWDEFKKAEQAIKNGYDFSDYDKMSKSDLGSFIYTFGKEPYNEKIEGKNLLSNLTDRLLVSYFYNSKFIS